MFYEKYLDANKLKADIEKIVTDKQSEPILPLNLIMEIIDRQPSADVTKISVAKWKKYYRDGDEIPYGRVSSCCDCWSNELSRYCPRCGAIMEIEKDD